MDDLRERLERLSARADDEANAIGRLHPNQVIDHFAKGVLGWSGWDLHAAISGPDFQELGISQKCSDPSTCQDVHERVWLVQPASHGQGGIWSVRAVVADGLDVTAN